jgi:hypothetical protein
MRHLFKTTIALLTVFALAGSAAAAKCKAVPPKDLEGQVQASLPGGESLTVTYFQNNACDWAGFEQLNGFDGFVFDVTEIAGTKGHVTAAITATGVFLVPLEGVFLDSSCAAIEGAEVALGTDGNAYGAAIPKDATWLAVSMTGGQIPNGGYTIELHSNGKVCKKGGKK